MIRWSFEHTVLWQPLRLWTTHSKIQNDVFALFFYLSFFASLDLRSDHRLELWFGWGRSKSGKWRGWPESDSLLWQIWTQGHPVDRTTARPHIKIGQVMHGPHVHSSLSLSLSFSHTLTRTHTRSHTRTQKAWTNQLKAPPHFFTHFWKHRNCKILMLWPKSYACESLM